MRRGPAVAPGPTVTQGTRCVTITGAKRIDIGSGTKVPDPSIDGLWWGPAARREDRRMGSAVVCEALTKCFGSVHAVEDLSFTVEPGEVVGFLGPNGAGKTTTIRLLLDLIRPTRGHVEVLGVTPRRGGAEVRRHIGYVAGDLAMYNRLTGRQLLEFLAALRGESTFESAI